jgi:hypothetical protein
MTVSTRQFRLIAVLVGLNLLLVVGGWMVLVSPQRHDAATAAAQAQLAQNQLAELIGANSGPHVRVKQPEIHTADLYTLDTALPAQADQPSLLLELSRLAKMSGVTIISISPQSAQANASGYTAVPINLNVNGSYFKLTGLLQRLRLLVSEHHGRLVANGPLFAVTSATFSPGAKKGQAAATVGLEAFYYGVTAGATPPASTTSTDTTTTTTGG